MKYNSNQTLFKQREKKDLNREKHGYFLDIFNIYRFISN